MASVLQTVSELRRRGRNQVVGQVVEFRGKRWGVKQEKTGTRKVDGYIATVNGERLSID